MINNSYSFENVIPIIDDVIRPCYLNKIQEIILKQVWEGKTYSEIAQHYNYDAEYIKTKGCELWKLLSKSFGTKIAKSTFVPFMRSQMSSLENNLKFAREDERTIDIKIPSERIYWATAPDVGNFQGRKAELAELNNWSRELCCRSIVISGMVGCGKTTLATKFAKEVSDRFDYVIWFSLTESLSVKTLLKNYLQIFASQEEGLLLDNSDNISSLLTTFIEYLRSYRCLLIIDNLDSILESNCATISYRQNSEEYAQLLRCLVATDHQSLSIFTSNIKPKVLQYYASDRVFFMNIDGLKQSTIDLVYRNRLKTNLTELEWQSLTQYCHYNPQIVNIFATNIDNILEEDFDWTLKEIALLKEISSLLEKELNNLSELEKEIVYWLAINCSCPKKELLERRVSYFRPKSQLQESFNFLKERGLICKQGGNYILQPLMKDYIQKKLIAIGLQY
jgi:DNA replication protein DnaC